MAVSMSRAEVVMISTIPFRSQGLNYGVAYDTS